MTANPQKIINVSALPNVRSVRVVWENAKESIIDLTQFIKEFSIFAPLDNDAHFSQVEVGEWGFEITWDAGGELSIAASTLHRLASEQSNDPARQFNAWMARQGFTNDAASRVLGLPKREVDYYRKGKKPVPKVVQLACRAIEMEPVTSYSKLLSIPSSHGHDRPLDTL